MCTCTILEGLQTCRLGRLFFSRAVVGRLRLNAPSISTTQNWRANPKTANLPKSYLQYRLSYQHMHESSMKKIKRYSTTPSFGPFPGLPWLCYFHCPVLEECPISHNKFHFPLPVKFPTSLWTQVQMETGCKATWLLPLSLALVGQMVIATSISKSRNCLALSRQSQNTKLKIVLKVQRQHFFYFFTKLFIFGCTVIVFHEINIYWYSCGDTFCDSNIKNMWFREQRLDSADFV